MSMMIVLHRRRRRSKSRIRGRSDGQLLMGGGVEVVSQVCAARIGLGGLLLLSGHNW